MYTNISGHKINKIQCTFMSIASCSLSCSAVSCTPSGLWEFQNKTRKKWLIKHVHNAQCIRMHTLHWRESPPVLQLAPSKTPTLHHLKRNKIYLIMCVLNQLWLMIDLWTWVPTEELSPTSEVEPRCLTSRPQARGSYASASGEHAASRWAAKKLIRGYKTVLDHKSVKFALLSLLNKQRNYSQCTVYI